MRTEPHKQAPSRGALHHPCARLRVRGPCVIVGPGKAFDWAVAYLIPTAVVLGVMVGTLVLLLREGGKAYDRWDKHGRDAFL